MRLYAEKSYGRNEDVAAIYKLFEADWDVSMHGPRRLGKTFLLDRLVDAAAEHGWVAVKVEIAGCGDARAVFRELCNRIDRHRSVGQTFRIWCRQRFGQLVAPRSDQSGEWYQPLINLDHESLFEKLLNAMQRDRKRRWALLIDEMPIFLKALHDQGPAGLVAARNFMNMTSRLRVNAPRVRWMITGSIGIGPLAHAGDYSGVLAKYKPYALLPLTDVQARDYVQDLARDGRLMHRQAISNAEADALVAAVGWCAPYYLEALAQKLLGSPTDDHALAHTLVEEAILRLLDPAERATFGPWEEHLRKHYREPDRALAYAILRSLASHPQGLRLDTLLTTLADHTLSRDRLETLQIRLHDEGFVTWYADERPTAFRNPMLRRWWHRYKPTSNP